MKYALIPILKEIDAFGDRFYRQSQELRDYNNESINALELLLKLYHANKPSDNEKP